MLTAHSSQLTAHSSQLTAHNHAYCLIRPEYLQDLSREETIRRSTANYFSDKPLTCEFVENGIVLPPKKVNTSRAWFAGGVLDAGGKYIDISAQRAQDMACRVDGAYNFDPASVVVRDERVVYMNCIFARQWGHFLMDMIGRLWYAANHPDCMVVYSCRNAERDKLSGSYLELVELMGISESRLLAVDRVTQFREIVVPESAIFPGSYFTKEYRELCDRVVANSGAVPGTSGKIYCSRSRFSVAAKKEKGEQYIEKVFADNGFRSVYMEKLTVREQVRTLNSAGEIAMVSGSLPHNLLFVRNNPRVTIISKTHLVNRHQPLVNQVSDSEVCYVDAYTAPLPVEYGLGPFIMAMTKEFMNYCKDNGLRVDEGLAKKASPVVSLRTKIWYYFRWLRNNLLNKHTIIDIVRGRWGSVKSFFANNFGENYRRVRDYYKAQQRGN